MFENGFGTIKSFKFKVKFFQNHDVFCVTLFWSGTKLLKSVFPPYDPCCAFRFAPTVPTTSSGPLIFLKSGILA